AQVTFSRNSPSEPVKKSAVSFTPDFSAVVRDDCTYLEITAQTYLLAYKSTLISKGSRSRLIFEYKTLVSELISAHSSIIYMEQVFDDDKVFLP
ncbi:unnamed protein product, partial [Brugia timori]|uniref:A2M_recep domain-containing protein n=1 Tax=Brugia timori TaxID=42155 RepID=A0A0R3Q6N1_9BILA